MTTIKDYAISRGTTRQNVYAMLQRHSKQLQGHIFVEGNAKVLDDFAVNYLDARARKIDETFTVIADNSLQEELAKANDKILELLNEISQLKQDKIEMLSEKNNLMLEVQEHRHLLEAKESEHTNAMDLLQNEHKHDVEVMQARHDLEVMQAKSEAIAEAESHYKKSWFGLYRKLD